MKPMEYAADMAEKALREAKDELAVAERTAILVDAIKRNGCARVMMHNGTICEINLSHGSPLRAGDVLLTDSRQQSEWNVYYTCRDWAVRSLHKPLPEPPKVKP